MPSGMDLLGTTRTCFSVSFAAWSAVRITFLSLGRTITLPPGSPLSASTISRALGVHGGSTGDYGGGTDAPEDLRQPGPARHSHDCGQGAILAPCTLVVLKEARGLISHVVHLDLARLPRSFLG